MKTALLVLIPVLLLALYTLSQTFDSRAIAPMIFTLPFVGAGLLVFLQSGIFNKLFGLVFIGMGGGDSPA